MHRGVAIPGDETVTTPKSPRGRDVRRMKKPWTKRVVDFTFPDGWTVEEVPPEDFELESYFMGHCLGRDTAYVPGVRAGTAQILSLREPDGTPHVTVVRGGPWHTANGKPLPITQCCGRGNRQPAKKYSDRIELWAAKRGIPGYNNNPWRAGAYAGDVNEDPAYHESGILDGRWVNGGVNPMHEKLEPLVNPEGLDLTVPEDG